jgi:hypothetical protein
MAFKSNMLVGSLKLKISENSIERKQKDSYHQVKANLVWQRELWLKPNAFSNHRKIL